MDRAGLVTPVDRNGEGAEADSFRRSAPERWSVHSAKEGARGGTMGSPTQEPRYEPVDAPEASSFPVPEPYADGERGYEPIKPRSGFGDLLRKLAAPLIALGVL